MKKHFKIPLILFFAFSGMVLIFTTCKKSEEPAAVVLPTATTYSASLVGQRWASLNGTINANNQTAIISFEYDTTSSYGHTIAADPDTVTGSEITHVSAYLTDLTPSTTYHFRVKSESSAGTSYGTDQSFSTSGISKSVIIFNPNKTYGSLTDIEGNIYKTILIGTQTWMAQNLTTATYNDGSAIPFITHGTTWSLLSSPGYCWYNNDSLLYGAMYNWYAVNTGKLCPTGWHVPTDAEWTTLTNFVGGENTASGKLKETGTTHWVTPNSGATNESGFTALPGGFRNSSGVFGNITRYGYWWSSTEASSTEAYFRDMSYNYVATDRSRSNKISGISVRCIKN